MAIAGCLVTYVFYRLLLRVFGMRPWAQAAAAAIAAYIAINFSALLAAVEFGIQPMFFKDAAGHPLYAPFPLHVTIPAMLIGHLTFAGLAELVITGGVVAYLKRTSPALVGAGPAAFGWKPVAAVLAVLIILTPLGLLTAGRAFGEWSPQEFQNTDGRMQIERAAGGAAAPSEVPSGLKRFATLWSAPLRDYSPKFISNPSAGYILSAVLGAALLLIVILSFGALARLGYRRVR